MNLAQNARDKEVSEKKSIMMIIMIMMVMMMIGDVDDEGMYFCSTCS